MKVERIAWSDVDWELLDSFSDRLVWQTEGWVEFLRETQHVEPVVLRIIDGSDDIAYFTGGMTKRFGVRIFGSPFTGWTTEYMGLNVRGGWNRRNLMPHIYAYITRDLGCAYFEVRDRYLSFDDVAAHRVPHAEAKTFELDLSPDEESLFKGMSGSCRTAVRKGQREGLIVEEVVRGGDGFATEFHEQLEDVFARQGLKPTYPRSRVASLVRQLLPTGHILLLRVRDQRGTCIATGIFPGMNDTAHFWGGASLRSQQILRPNEAMFWYAIRYWKARGIRRFDFGGGGDYKRRYGPVPLRVPIVKGARFPLIVTARDLAERSYRAGRAAAAVLRNGKGQSVQS
jgi:hypothetical protein